MVSREAPIRPLNTKEPGPMDSRMAMVRRPTQMVATIRAKCVVV